MSLPCCSETITDQVNAVPQVLPHEAKTRQSAETEPPNPTMDPSTHWQYHPVRARFFYLPVWCRKGIIVQSCAAAAHPLGIKADSEWPTDTTRSEDIGGRRELVSRSKWCGERYRAEGETGCLMLDGRRMRIVLGLDAEAFTQGQLCTLNVMAWQLQGDF